MAQLMKQRKAATVLYISNYKEIQKFDPKDTIIITDLNCQDSGRFLQQADENHVFSKPYRWLIIAKPNGFRNVPTELIHMKIFVDSEVIFAEKTIEVFNLNLVYRIDLTSEFRTEEFGIWTADEGFKKSENVARTTMVIRRKDLSGKAIAASYVINDNRTKTDIHELKYLKVDHMAKATHYNILPLYDFMNATKVFRFTDTWGYYINNSWNGMMGDIIHGEAELCGTVSFISLARVHLIQYITQPIPIIPKFVFREPPLSFQNNLFILPFRGAVWISIGGLVAILIVIIYINAKWETAMDKETIVKESTILKPNVSDIGIFVISAITQQGSTNELKGYLGRIVTFLMFLIFLFLYTSYSANIVALLQSSSKQIRTLPDLVNSKLELGVEDAKYNRYYFPTATEPVRKRLYETKIEKVGYKPNFMSLEEGVRRLKNKETPFAFLMNLGIGYKIVEELFHEHEKCGLHEIAYYPNSIPWVCSRKVSPYREIYKIGLARTLEHGLGDRVNRIFYLRKPFCNMRGGSFASVNMVDFHPVLLWMLYGMSLSVFLLVVEILLFRRQRQMEKA